MNGAIAGAGLPAGRSARVATPLLLVCALGLLSGLSAPAVAQSSAARMRAAAAASPGGEAGFRYRLGPGDRLVMSVFKVDGYQAEVEVLSDGTINLPRIGSVAVAGLTIDEARQEITRRYNVILRRPIVYLDLREPRPVRVSVSGEVQRPGLYSLSSRGGSAQLSSAGASGSATTITAVGWPTLVDAIQRAGGISTQGDLRDIEILRSTGVPGQPPQRLHFDFLAVLRDGQPARNPLVYDGDTIRVPRAESLSNADLLASSSSAFAPESIQVQVIGEVVRPGLQQIRANSPLALAIHSAGGPTRRASRSTIELIRMGPDGQPTVQTLRFDPAATLSSLNNPPLRQGDVVVVKAHGWARFNDTLQDTLMPVGPVINAASILRLLGF